MICSTMSALIILISVLGITAGVSTNCNHLNIFDASIVYNTNAYYDCSQDPSSWAKPILEYFRHNVNEMAKPSDTEQKEGKDCLVAGTKRILMMLYSMDLEPVDLSLKTDAIDAFEFICTPKNASKRWYQLHSTNWNIVSSNATEQEERVSCIVECILRGNAGKSGLDFRICEQIFENKKKRF